MSSAVAGYKQTLGADAPPACYDDLRHAQCLFIIGSNTAWAHRCCFAASRTPGAPTHNSRSSWPTRAAPTRPNVADLHLALQPGTDVRLLGGMLHLMQRGAGSTAPTSPRTPRAWGAAAAYRRMHARARGARMRHRSGTCSPPRAGSPDWRAAQAAAHAHAQPVLPGPEPEQQRHKERRPGAPAPGHGADRQARRGAALAHRPVQRHGRAQVGGMAHLLSSHRDLANPAHRAEVAALWGVSDVPARPARPPWKCSRLRPTADQEPCGSPARTRRKACPTRPGAAPCSAPSSWWCRTPLPPPPPAAMPICCCPPAPGAKTGTVTNSERRISRVRSAVPRPRRGAARLADRGAVRTGF